MSGSLSIGRSTLRSSFGKAVTAQKEVLFVPSMWRPNPNVPVVLLSHGALGDAYSWTGPTSHLQKAQILSERYGLPCVAGDLDGAPASLSHAVGNDAAQAAALSLIYWAQAQLGAKTGPGSALVLGTSMGSHLTWNLHKNNPGLIRAAAHALMTYSVQRNYDLSITLGQPYHTWVDESYSNIAGGWPAAQATHDPAVYKNSLGPMKLNVFLANTTDDTTNHDDAVADVLAMAAAVGPTAEYKFYGLGGHDISKIDDDDVARFLMKNSGLN